MYIERDEGQWVRTSGRIDTGSSRYNNYGRIDRAVASTVVGRQVRYQQ
jgi:hypothetical protein